RSPHDASSERFTLGSLSLPPLPLPRRRCLADGGPCRRLAAMARAEARWRLARNGPPRQISQRRADPALARQDRRRLVWTSGGGRPGLPDRLGLVRGKQDAEKRLQ